MRKGSASRGTSRQAPSWWCLPFAAALLVCAWSGREAMAESPAAAPDFALRALDGHNYRLSEYRGDVVAVIFWASWCGGCRSELERLDRLQGIYRDAGFQVLGVTVDESPDLARSVAAGIGVGFPQLHDADKSVSKTYRPDKLPTTFFVDRGGIVRFTYGELDSRDERAVLGELRRLLDE